MQIYKFPSLNRLVSPEFPVKWQHHRIKRKCRSILSCSNMKTITLVVIFAASAAASGTASFRMEPSPVYTSQRNNIPIVRFAQDTSAGSDTVSFETGNGIVVDDSTQVVAGQGGSYQDAYGKLVKTDSSVVKRGSYTYTSPEGRPITVKWVADANGFRAEGDHLPVVPPQQPLPVRDMIAGLY